MYVDYKCCLESGSNPGCLVSEHRYSYSKQRLETAPRDSYSDQRFTAVLDLGPTEPLSRGGTGLNPTVSLYRTADRCVCVHQGLLRAVRISRLPHGVLIRITTFGPEGHTAVQIT